MVPAKLWLRKTRLLVKPLVDSLESRRILVDAIYLFGSYARGEARSFSDIDLIVVSPSFVAKSVLRRYALVGTAIGALTDQLMEPIDVLPLTPKEFQHPEPGGFLESIRRDLKVLYQRRRKARTRT